MNKCRKLIVSLKFFFLKLLTMKFSISINQKAIVDNGFNIKGSSLETWALLDFLLFFQNANNLKKINKDDKCYIWINYKYIINNSPLCHFYNASIKK
ncbi:hypothetical protein, partial [uncultured Helicobacter sp.]|uniref:hypothetical protein n=1 Tax=uncultured Helicobacter sp. TaxID=175537 RepID=UPI002608DEA7